jgi:hypothetical protein
VSAYVVARKRAPDLQSSVKARAATRSDAPSPGAEDRNQ